MGALTLTWAFLSRGRSARATPSTSPRGQAEGSKEEGAGVTGSQAGSEGPGSEKPAVLRGGAVASPEDAACPRRNQNP